MSGLVVEQVPALNDVPKIGVNGCQIEPSCAAEFLTVS